MNLPLNIQTINLSRNVITNSIRDRYQWQIKCLASSTAFVDKRPRKLERSA